MGQYWTLAGLIWFVMNAFSLFKMNSFTGTTTNGSPNVTGLSSTTGLAVGQTIVGPNVPAGTTILSINTGASSLVMSANATASGSGPLWSAGSTNQGLPLAVHLIAGPVPASQFAAWSNITEAAYDGYVPQQCAYPFVVSTPDKQNVVGSCQLMTFAPTDYLVPQTITGLAWTYTAPGASAPTLVAVEAFKNPVNLSVPGDIIRVTPVLALPTNVLGIAPSPVLM